MAALGLEEVDAYFLRRQNTVAQYIATRPILELCLVLERRLGSHVSQRWWETDGINLGLGKGRFLERVMVMEVDGEDFT